MTEESVKRIAKNLFFIFKSNKYYDLNEFR